MIVSPACHVPPFDLPYAATDAPVDEHSADQLILPLAFAEGASEYRVSRVTKHLLTNVEVVRKFILRRIECIHFVGPQSH